MSFAVWSLETLLSTMDFLETTNVGVILHDEDGVVLECNTTAAVLFGTTSDGLVGRAFLDAGGYSAGRSSLHNPSEPRICERRMNAS